MTRAEKILQWRIARRYPKRWLIGYAIGKLRCDPAYRAVLERIGESALPLLDVGCGMGLLAFYLREHGFAPAITGLDVDETKIFRATRIAQQHTSGITFQTADALSLPEFSGHITLLDVLHYLPPAEQARVLAGVARRIAPGGTCIIRTTPRDNSARFRCTLAIERLATALTWMTRPPQSFPTLEEISRHFPAPEFTPEIRPLWGRTPFNSWLLAFRRVG